MEQLIFVIVIAAIYFLQWAIKAGAKFLSEQQGGAGQTGASEEERMRRFMEALGQDPKRAAQPPQLPRQAQPQQRRQPPPIPQMMRKVAPPPTRPSLTPEKEPAEVSDGFPQDRSLESDNSPENLPPAVRAALKRLEEGAAFATPEQKTNLERAMAKKTDPRDPQVAVTLPTLESSNLAGFLKSSAGLRQAILAHEILGKPVGLR